MVVRTPWVSISAVARAMVFVLLLSALLAGAASAQSNVSSCITISSPGTYILNTSVTNTTPVVACINITSSNVVLDGAGNRVYGADILNTFGVFVFNSTTDLTNVTIKNLNVTDWYYGIYYRNAHNGSIVNNNVSSNRASGVRLLSSHNNTITNNNISYNNQGFFFDAGIYFDSSNNNTVRANYISNNPQFGVILSSSDNNTFTDNDIVFNCGGQAGVSLSSSNSNTFNSNNISDNTGSGIELSSSNNNAFTNNIVDRNNAGGLGNAGAYLTSSTGNTFTNNTANRNRYGIYLTYSSTSNTLIDNTANSNTGIFDSSGIKIEYSSNDNSISAGTVYNNSVYGIKVSSSNGINITGVGIHNNTNTGILDDTTGYASNQNFSYNKISGSSKGIRLIDEDNSIVLGNEIWNTTDGILLDSSGYYSGSLSNNITQNHIHDNQNGISIVLFSYSGGNIVTQNHIHDNQNGITLTNPSGYGYSGGDTIYNNLFNNTNNVNIDAYSQGLSSWNTTKTAGTNIVGRSFIGGNFWAYPNGTGFSETCADSELDGICNSPYDINGAGDFDFLPLNTLTGITIPPLTQPPMDANTTNSSGFINLTDFGFSQTLINQMGVTGYEYILTTNGTTPAVNISVNIFIEPPAGVTNISNISGVLPGFYYQISVNDSSWFSNITNIQLKIFYNSSNLPTGVSESSLRPMRFTNGSWVRLDCAELGGCNATLADGTTLFDAGVVTSAVNATHPYVWANLSNFSVYGIGGSITPSPAAPAPTGTYKPRAVVLANSIDRALAADFYGFLRNQGIEIIEATAANFDAYKSSARFIIILGGPNAPEGVGDIVRGILSEEEQKFLRTRGNRKMYVKTNIWRTGQVVRIIAGSGRDQTQEEWQANREDVGRRIRYNLD